MFRIGLELEEFCTDAEGNIILVPKNSNIPHDGCGWLIEYRGEACSHIIDAVYSLRAAEFKASALLQKAGVKGVREPVMKPSKDIRLAARRRFIKNIVAFNNLYGHKSHRNNMSEAVAAVHVSITMSEEAKYGRTNKIWDFADFVRHMDKAFAEEIKAAKRRPGFYEIKSDGRFEYRSLPNNVDQHKLMTVINSYTFK